jgi:hypothetical protein
VIDAGSIATLDADIRRRVGVESTMRSGDA